MRSAPLVLLVGLIAGTASAEERILPAQGQLGPVAGVNLGIADDETFRRPNSWSELVKPTKFADLLPTEKLLRGDLSGPASRPGMSIAWRNAAQVEEVEVRVRNLGDQPSEARLFVDVLDDEGNILLHLEPPDELKVIRLPSFPNGGREGKILRMKASRELNNLIDQFDREDRRYNVRATVETVGTTDVDPSDNIKTKSWNVPHRVDPGQVVTFNYRFRNPTSQPVTVRWLFERTPYPEGWLVEGVPKDAEPFTIGAGQEIRGTLSLKGPETVAEGAFLETRLTLLNADKGTVWQQHEWFLVHDTIPPVVTDYRLVATDDHRIAIQALVSDQGSGVMEATGVSTQYSTDGGLTWSARAHNYKSGNFVIPTLFEAVLGPFAEGTDLQLRFTAKDTAGNAAAIIPDAAMAIAAPKGAEKLIELAKVFPRTQPNAIFTIDPGPIDVGQIASQFAVAIANSSTEKERVETLSSTLSSIPLSTETKTMLLQSAENLSADPSKKAVAERFEQLLNDLPVTTQNTTTVESITLNRIDAPGSQLLKQSTIGLKVR